MCEAAATTNARDGIRVRFGGFVEKVAEFGLGEVGGRGGGEGTHGGAKIGDFREDCLDDVDAAFVEGAHGYGFPRGRIVAEVEEGGQLDDELVTCLCGAIVEF